MSMLEKKLAFYKDQVEHLPKSLSAMVRDVVTKNVTDYLDTLNNVSPEEELRMLQRKPRQSDNNVNKNYRDRVNSFKQLNREIKQQTGGDVVPKDALGVPLKTALIDDSILQLYKMANEIALLLKSGKIDGPSLNVLVEKAVDNVTRKTSNHEVKDMMLQLIEQVELKYGQIIMKDLESEKEKFFKEISNKVNNIKITGT